MLLSPIVQWKCAVRQRKAWSNRLHGVAGWRSCDRKAGDWIGIVSLRYSAAMFLVPNPSGDHQEGGRQRDYKLRPCCDWIDTAQQLACGVMKQAARKVAIVAVTTLFAIRTWAQTMQ